MSTPTPTAPKPAPVPVPQLPAGYRFVSDKESIDARLGDIHAALNHESIYWGKERSVEMLRKQIGQSWRVVLVLLGGEESQGELAALCRVVGDGMDFGYLADVVTIHRGKNLSLPMVHEAIFNSAEAGSDKPSTQWQWCLLTKDAFWLYEKLGFSRDMKLGMWLMPTEGPGRL